MSVEMVGCLPGPVSLHRSNCPHPKRDFLLPKNLVKMDEQQKFQAHINQSVRDYLGKVYQNGHYTNPQLADIIQRTLGQSNPSPLPEANTPDMVMRESEMMENYVNPTEAALEKIMAEDKQLLKRQQGNSFKEAGKVYHEIADAKEQLESPQHPKPVFATVNRKLQLGSDHHKAHWLHWPKANPPTPGKKGLHENLAASYQAKYSQPSPARPTSGPPTMTTKRLHTPPTPPDRSRRIKSAAYEAQVESIRRSQSLPPSVRSKSATSLLDERPKTVGPQLAKSMAMHPRMKAWIDSATDYEKEVAFSMLRTLSGRKMNDEEFNKLEAKLNCTPSKPRTNGSQPRKTWAKPMIPPATHTFNSYVPPSPAPVKPVPVRSGKADRTTKDWMKKVEQTINDRMTPQERTTYPMLPGVGSRPLAHHKPRPRKLGDYRHENSFFTCTNKGVNGQFIIAPDWVSERVKQRRPKKPSNDQLRYGSK